MDIRNVYGITPKKANDLKKYYNITTIDALRKYTRKIPDIVTEEQRLGLKYHSKVCNDVDFAEVNRHAKFIIKNIKNAILAGSYRRQERKVGDIDLLITGNMNTTLNTLIEAKYIVTILSKNNNHSSSIVKLPNTSSYRRLDIVKTTAAEKPFALLYYTGDFIQNVSMKQKAKRMGFTLTQYGIFDSNGNPITGLKSERDIFEFLQMKYKEPEERIHSDKKR
jgi:DNA polymerase/3'-5' exonuclease PolX